MPLDAKFKVVFTDKDGKRQMNSVGSNTIIEILLLPVLCANIQLNNAS